MQRFALASAVPLLASAHTAFASRRLIGTTAANNSTSTSANATESSSPSTASAADGRTQEEINRMLREKIERLEAQHAAAAQGKETNWSPKTAEDFFRRSGGAEGDVFSHRGGGIMAHPFFELPPRAARFSPFLKAPTSFPQGYYYHCHQPSFLGFLFKVFLWVMVFKMLFALLMVSSAPHQVVSTTIVGPDGTLVPVRYYGNPYYSNMFSSSSSCGSLTGGCPAWAGAPQPKDGTKNVAIQ